MIVKFVDDNSMRVILEKSYDASRISSIVTTPPNIPIILEYEDLGIIKSVEFCISRVHYDRYGLPKIVYVDTQL